MSNTQEIELYIEDIKPFVEAGKALDRLRKNRDYKKLIEEGYFRDEAVRLVSIKADPNLQSPEKQAIIIKEIDAIGSLQGFLNNVARQANSAKDAIEAAEAELLMDDQADELEA